MSDQAKQLRDMFKQHHKKIEIITVINQAPVNSLKNMGYKIVHSFFKQRKHVLYVNDQLNNTFEADEIQEMSFEQFKTNVLNIENHHFLNHFDSIVIETDLTINHAFIEKIAMTTYPIFVFESDPKKLMHQYELIKYVNQIKQDEAGFVMTISNHSTVHQQLVNEITKASEQFLNVKLSFLGYCSVEEQSDNVLAIHENLTKRLQERHLKTDMEMIKEQLSIFRMKI